jgi:serine/threonine protein kinase
MDTQGFEVVSLRKGDVFHGRYAVERCIKAGGMGTVYEVRDANEDAARALKVILPRFAAEPRYKKSFEREAALARTIRHPHVVRTYEAGVDEALAAPFLVMELLHGEDLASVLRRGRLATERAVELLGEAASALDALHAAGIVHRDVKPANLFLAGATLKVIDFGLAKLAFDPGDSRSTLAVGTPLFMAPEQIEGGVPITPACDRYALAQVAFCALVGRPFWEHEARETDGVFPLLLRIASGAREAASLRARRAGVHLPPELDNWFARATARSPHDRFESAREMVGDLARILATTMGAPHPRLHREGRSRALRTVVAAAAVLGVMGGALGVPASRSAPDRVQSPESPESTARAAAEPAPTTEQAQAPSSAAGAASLPSIEPKTASTRGPVTAPVRVAPASRASRGAPLRALPSAAPASVPTVDGPW